jgi:hypothetical protein
MCAVHDSGERFSGGNISDLLRRVAGSPKKRREPDERELCPAHAVDEEEMHVSCEL